MNAFHNNFAATLFPRILDMIALAVFLVSADGAIVHANTKANRVLQDQDLLQSSRGKLTTARRDVASKKLSNAIALCAQVKSTITTCSAVALQGHTGERAVAYVLPVEPGFAAIFIASRQDDRRMALELLGPMFDLTPTEAAVAYAASRGDSPETISTALGNTIATVRSHLKSIYAKADVPNKTVLAARVSALMPPIALA